MVYVEEPAEVCVPTLETECDQEDGGQTLELRTEEECQDVVRTVCVERHNVVDNEGRVVGSVFRLQSQQNEKTRVLLLLPRDY